MTVTRLWSIGSRTITSVAVSGAWFVTVIEYPMPPPAIAVGGHSLTTSTSVDGDRATAVTHDWLSLTSGSGLVA
jgi:hypothetical protein